jgi:hypothetical protein
MVKPSSGGGILKQQSAQPLMPLQSPIGSVRDASFLLGQQSVASTR